MNLFSDIYNCYFQIMKSLLKDSDALSQKNINKCISEMGYEESLLFLVPKLTSGEWDLFKREDDLYISKISKDFFVPLTSLQKSYIKTILADKRIQLFLDENEIADLNSLLADVPLLWNKDDFYYYDSFSNKDDFSDSQYKQHFRTLIYAMEHQQYVDIEYESRNNHRVHHHYLPCRLEYSIKNGKFRLLAAGMKKNSKYKNTSIEIMNLERMQEVTLLPAYAEEIPDINSIIRSSYYREPVRIRIHNYRNALERTMLQFANYEKNTTKIDENTYECLIYYNLKTETELLIEILSFGPMIEVLGSERFLRLLKERLLKQYRLKGE
ncbi:MAG: WYL domain-containing protein [Lachnospiraceae bacterium]|nr:WYL domain-containing protein [Lachnospiraceae bacterium]